MERQWGAWKVAGLQKSFQETSSLQLSSLYPSFNEAVLYDKKTWRVGGKCKSRCHGNSSTFVDITTLSLHGQTHWRNQIAILREIVLNQRIDDDIIFHLGCHLGCPRFGGDLFSLDQTYLNFFLFQLDGDFMAQKRQR